MTNQIKIKKFDLGFALLVFLMLGVLIGVQVTPRFSEQFIQPDIGGEVVITMPLPAVDSEGNGVVGTLFTTVKPGSGRIFVDTSRVLNYLDTQLSARTAATAASNYARVNLSSLDITYAIRVNASIIEGPSAGASMAVSVLLALENRTSDSIAMTGTINPDGSIGRVGAILEKGLVAKESGATVYLVPEGQAKAERTIRNTTCSKFGSMDICRVRYEAEIIDLGSFLGIEVHEVRDIGEAFQFFNRTG
ncbi:MAG: hypothetical protein HY517_03100 [Candidatus Aenigmarchaeota archaeon]|nr:hypothetical protein [Candidatus Aenigmarchaeota archaeon]